MSKVSEQKRNYQKLYYEANKDIINKQRMEHYRNNKELYFTYSKICSVKKRIKVLQQKLKDLEKRKAELKEAKMKETKNDS